MKTLFLLLMICSASQLSAASFGLSFVGSDASKGTLAADTVAGVPQFQQSGWNNRTSAADNGQVYTTYFDTDGNAFSLNVQGVDATNASLNLNTTDGLHDANDTLMNGFALGAVNNGGKVDFAFQSIPLSYQTTGYSVIVYADGNSSDVLHIGIGVNRARESSIFYLKDSGNFSGSFIRATSTSAAAPTVGANYVQFDNLNAADFTLYFNLETTGGRRFVNAIQVVQQVPEPSTVCLLVAALGIGCITRRLR